MKAKQIVKVRFNNEEMYGVCLGENKLLLENGRVILDVNDPFIYKPFLDYTSYGYPIGVMETILHEGFARGLKISNTRNVPSEIRSVLEKACGAYNHAVEIMNKINPLLKQLGQERKVVADIPADIRDGGGFLLPHEFEYMFLCSLTGEVGRRVRECEEQCVGYYNAPEPFEASVFHSDTHLYLQRTVLIDRNFRNGSFIYKGDDGNVHLKPNAQKDPDYQWYLKQHSSPLPVKNYEYTETLNVGGNGFFTYCLSYDIPLTKPLTEHYAQELAKAFSDDRVLQKPKGKNKDNIER